MSNLAMSTEDAVRRLAVERPDWLPVLEAAAAVAARTEAHGGEFAGALVLGELAARGGPSWINNLRLLTTYGLIEKSGDSTRGGRRAYYRMPDREGVERALEKLRPARRARFRFIGAGASGTPGAEIARTADEAPYEPRSWR